MFTATVLRVRLGAIGSRGVVGKVAVGLQLTLCPQKSYFGVCCVYLLELGSVTKQQIRGGSTKEDGLWDPQEMLAGVREGCFWCFVVMLEMRLGH